MSNYQLQVDALHYTSTDFDSLTCRKYLKPHGILQGAGENQAFKWHSVTG